MFKLELQRKKTQIWMNTTELLAMTDSSQRVPGASQTQVKAQSQSWGLYGLNSEVTAQEVDSDSTKKICHRILHEPRDTFMHVVFVLLLQGFVLKFSQQGESCLL